MALLLSPFHEMADDPVDQAPPMPGQLVDVGTYRVHLYCTGEGKPAVVIAGGGYSVDWGLVQPEIAKSVRVCTYDPAGTAWSDKAKPHPACVDRVNELYTLLHNASVEGPYVLVGFSIGGLVVRLYTALYPEEVAGLVFVDHAFIETAPASPSVPPQPSAKNSDLDSPPVLISQTPIALDIEDDQNFSKLPKRNQELHRWALSIDPARPTAETASECFAAVDAREGPHAYPLGDKPIAVVSTLYDSPRYTELQHKLLMLSRRSQQFVAENSTHMVIIDQPRVVVEAVRHVVAATRQGRFNR